MTYHQTHNDIPKTPHYAIIESSSVLIGYSTRTQKYIKYQSFMSRDEWEKEIQRKTASCYGSRDFIAMYVTPANVSVSVDVKVKVDD